MAVVPDARLASSAGDDETYTIWPRTARFRLLFLVWIAAIGAKHWYDYDHEIVDAEVEYAVTLDCQI